MTSRASLMMNYIISIDFPHRKNTKAIYVWCIICNIIGSNLYIINGVCRGSKKTRGYARSSKSM